MSLAWLQKYVTEGHRVLRLRNKNEQIRGWRRWQSDLQAAELPRELKLSFRFENLEADLRSIELFLDKAETSQVKTEANYLCQGKQTVGAILTRFEDALKRWPEQWPIRTEDEVQSIVWLILKSYFDDLVDEETLPKFGHSSYTADYGLPSLGLLVEVKVARKAQDFKKIEKAIMEDSIGYLLETQRYNKLLVFIYDQSISVQHHGTTRVALKKIPQIEDVVIVCRPSQLPSSM
jgi:hypothetical protein